MHLHKSALASTINLEMHLLHLGTVWWIPYTCLDPATCQQLQGHIHKSGNIGHGPAWYNRSNGSDELQEAQWHKWVPYCGRWGMGYPAVESNSNTCTCMCVFMWGVSTLNGRGWSGLGPAEDIAPYVDKYIHFLYHLIPSYVFLCRPIYLIIPYPEEA